ncbi:hypothetical protein J7L81_04945 [Candidatus Aerophobetes bacterium]|nr:hypothetical protein [Candidatus Aerophobetes bacterium]
MKRHVERIIAKRRKRKEKLRKLREKYLAAKTDEERQKVLDKAKRIAPWLSQEEFLEPIRERLEKKEEEKKEEVAS